jgi:hypothetical protein
MAKLTRTIRTWKSASLTPTPPKPPGDVKISTNVRIKSLERRTLKVNVYPITSAVPGRPDATVSPNFTQQEIQTYFDRVYLSQANLKCQIVLKPATIITWDNSTEGNYSQPFEDQGDNPKVASTIPESPHSIDVMASIRPQILNTMAHEIGHLIITFGHPDQYNPTVNDPNDPLAHGGGPAPLAMDAFLHQLAHRAVRPRHPLWSH